MNCTQHAREMVQTAKESPDHMAWQDIDTLPCLQASLQRKVHDVSKGTCKIKSHDGKFVVIDFGWMAD